MIYVSPVTPADALIVLSPDPEIEAFKKDVDESLIAENLKLSFSERYEKFARFLELAKEVRRAFDVARKEGRTLGA